MSADFQKVVDAANRAVALEERAIGAITALSGEVKQLGIDLAAAIAAADPAAIQAVADNLNAESEKLDGALAALTPEPATA